MKRPKLEYYLNPVLQKYLNSNHRKKALVAGRGFSKSFGNGKSITQKVKYLPRGIGSFLGETYTQILTNTLLPMINSWERDKYYRDYHYVIGKRPPKHFKLAYQAPKRYDNVISWFNGLTVVLGSMDRPELLRGGNRDFNITDEALNLDQDKYKTIIVPTLRGSDIRLRERPHFKNQEFTTSMPHYYSKGRWILDIENEAKKRPNDVLYLEGTSFDNVAILGEDTIREWMRDMGKYRFGVECMNLRIRNLGTSFYASLTDAHWYDQQYNYNHIDNLEFDTNKLAKPDSRWDADCDPNQPLNLSHDWGGRINCITIDQEINNQVKFINAMHVKPPKMIDDLAQDFCDYYKYHKKKVVYQWGDKSGANKQANSKLSYFEQFADVLINNGWTVIRKHLAIIDHAARYRFVNKMLKGDDPRIPVVSFNINKCSDLKIALDSAPVKDLQKDKSSETNASVLPEHATHYTDCVDYRLYCGYYHRTKSRSYTSPVEIV